MNSKKLNKNQRTKIHPVSYFSIRDGKFWGTRITAALHSTSPWHSLLCIHAELQEPHEDGGDVQVGLPHCEATPQEVHGCTADRGVGRQLAAGRRQQQERQCSTCQNQQIFLILFAYESINAKSYDEHFLLRCSSIVEHTSQRSQFSQLLCLGQYSIPTYLQQRRSVPNTHLSPKEKICAQYPPISNIEDLCPIPTYLQQRRYVLNTHLSPTEKICAQYPPISNREDMCSIPTYLHLSPAYNTD